MALAFLNRCIWRASAGGTDSFEPDTATEGFLLPIGCLNPAVISGATYRYFAQSDDMTEWEVGYGVWDGTDIARTTILESSNAGSIVTFTVAPRVTMGGATANDVEGEGFELIAYFDFDENPTAQALVDNIEPYSTIRLRSQNIRIDPSSVSEPDNWSESFIQMYDDEGTSLFLDDDIGYEFAYVDVTSGTPTYERVYITCADLHLVLTKTVGVIYNISEFYTELYEEGQPELGSNVDSTGTKKFLSQPSTAVSMALCTVRSQFNSGKLWVYGRR